jgi:hypothetical protein
MAQRGLYGMPNRWSSLEKYWKTLSPVPSKSTKALKVEEEVKFTFPIVMTKRSRLRKNFRNSVSNYPISLKTPNPSLGTLPTSQP